MIAGRALPINDPPLEVPQTEVGVPELGIRNPPGIGICAGVPGAAHALGNCSNAPVGSRFEASSKTSLQMTFSKNTPIPPRTEVLPFFHGSQANPTWGAKLRLGCDTRLPRPCPGSNALSSGNPGY